jgi:serine/threonine-protein kinase
VALKILSAHRTPDREVLSRFQAETEVLRKLSHPNIVRAFDCGYTGDGIPYLAMELLNGETLEARVAREGTFSIDETLRVACELAAGIHAAHHAGVVHRDLKPENVFLHERAEAPSTVKILDFGSSMRAWCEEPAHARYQMLGTPRYMAPEQALGDEVDARADQYAFATIVFEMLAGRPPFIDEHLGTLIHRIVAQPPPSITELAPHVPAPAAAVLRRALSKEPGERYTDVRAFLSALRSSVPVAPDDATEAAGAVA